MFTAKSALKESQKDNFVIKVRKLGKNFGQKWAVKGLDLSIKKGEIYGLLGPNGAGKTTSLRMIASLLEPTEGRIEVAGIDPLKSALEAKKKIGFLTGNTGLYDRLSPQEILRFFGKLQEMKRPHLNERIEQLTEELDLGDFVKRPCGTLSTGQKQRVNIARTLLHEPEILILDEPTSGLDIISADFILRTIKESTSQGKTVLFSTHILVETELLCDRIGILHQGELASEGTLQELLKETDSDTLASAFLQIVTGSKNQFHDHREEQEEEEEIYHIKSPSSEQEGEVRQ